MGQLSDFYSVYFMLAVLTLRQLSGSAHSLLASKEVADFSEYARKAFTYRVWALNSGHQFVDLLFLAT